MAAQDGNRNQRPNLPTDIAGLLIASVACVGVLTVAVADGDLGSVGSFGLRDLIIMAVLTGAVAFVVVAALLLFRALREARSFEEEAAQAVTELKRDLQTAELVLSAGEQTIIAWEGEGTPRLIVNTFAAIPTSLSHLLVFRDWLQADTADALGHRLDRLFQNGQSFSFVGTSRDVGPLEIDGSTSAGRVILTLRPLSDERRLVAERASREAATDGELNRVRHFCDALPGLVWFETPNSRLTWANAAYAKAVEKPSGESAVAEQAHVLEAAQRSLIAATLKDNGRYDDRVHLIVAGERRAYQLTAVTLPDRIAFAANDISDLETTEGELRRQIAAHDRTLDRVATGIAIFGADDRLVFTNEAYNTLWQLDSDWLASCPPDAEILDRLRERGLLPVEADYRSWKSKLMAAARSPEELEDWWHLPDGRTIHVIGERRPDGGVVYLYDDVTERLALESRYNELIGVQGATLDNLREGVAVFATDGRLRLHNPAFAKIWKLRRKELSEQPHVDQIVERCRPLLDDSEVWTHLKRSITGLDDGRDRTEGEMARPDGSVVVYSSMPLPDGATLVTFADITDRRRVERALRERNDALEAADRQKSAFISHVSYELRTPLTSISGFSELLQSPRTGTLNGKQREYLGAIHASSQTLETIVNDILDLATIDAGNFELVLRDASVADMVETVLEQLADRIARAKMTVHVDLVPEDTHIAVDPSRMTTVLYKLVANAIGFSEPGQNVWIVGRLQAESDGYTFEIRDEGCGIPADHQTRVFERFESHTRRGKHRGAGLGLPIVKSFVELHGGAVSLTSEADAGTTITVTLPPSSQGEEDDDEHVMSNTAA